MTNSAAEWWVHFGGTGLSEGRGSLCVFLFQRQGPNLCVLICVLDSRGVQSRNAKKRTWMTRMQPRNARLKPLVGKGRPPGKLRKPKGQPKLLQLQQEEEQQQEQQQEEQPPRHPAKQSLPMRVWDQWQYRQGNERVRDGKATSLLKLAAEPHVSASACACSQYRRRGVLVTFP
jgi:hypothetical protein